MPGEVAEVRPATEILSTLSSCGTLGGLPFMPEMLDYCGQQFRVWRRVEKTCVEGDRVRRMKDVVFLGNLRCSGAAHDGCEKECRLFWHVAWLRRPTQVGEPSAALCPALPGSSLPVRKDEGRYVCQSTELLRATHRLSKLDVRQYYRDWRLKTYPSTQLLRLLFLPLWIRIKVLGCGMSVVRLRGDSNKTPTMSLDLKPGDSVMVRSRDEIRQTLDHRGRNRGLEFTPYMLPFCGRQMKVRRRVNRMILETSGEMRPIQNTVILEDCTCDGHIKWGGCPRDAQHLWREIWLKKL
jgi:hypothetical protein